MLVLNTKKKETEKKKIRKDNKKEKRFQKNEDLRKEKTWWS